VYFTGPWGKNFLNMAVLGILLVRITNKPNQTNLSRTYLTYLESHYPNPTGGHLPQFPSK